MSFQNWHKEYGDFWLENSKVSKIYNLMGCFFTKVYNVWAKKVQRNYISWHLSVIQNLKKNWLVVWKMTWGIWQIFTRAHERPKLGTLIRSFHTKSSLKLTGELCAMTMKNDANLKRNCFASSKLTWRILKSLTRPLKNLKNIHFNGLLLTKVYNVWAKRSIEELCLMAMKIDVKP